MRNLIKWFKCHWKKALFKYSIVFIIVNILSHLFFTQGYHDFMVFIFLVAGKELITNLIKNDAFITALGIGVVGVITGIFKKHDDKNDN